MNQDYVTIKGPLVKDHQRQYSYNLTNKHDAKTLCQTLNQSYTILDTYRNIETQSLSSGVIKLCLLLMIFSQ